MTGPDPSPTVTRSPIITIENLARSFGDNQVLADVDLTVDPGELVGLVGPNGAGKTTLLRAASGALEPDSGRVEIDGVDVNAAPSKVASRTVAVVPQDTALSFSFPVRDVVAMGRYPHRSRFSPATDEDRRAVDRALERTRTTDLADRRIDEISGGQRQRVIVARAVAQETPALLLDEPTASLDVNHQLETLELVREVVDDGTAAMAAIHDLSLAARYCDRLALLADGTIRHVGPPAEVLTADAVGDAFDASAVVATDPVSGATSVTALPDPRSNPTDDSVSSGGEPAGTDDARMEATDEPTGPSTRAPGDDQDTDQVHVLGAGPVASSAVARLALADVSPTVGPLPAGDVAAETATQFDLETVETDPYSPPSASETEAVTEAIQRADAVVVADPILGVEPSFEGILEAVTHTAVVIGVSGGADATNAADQADTHDEATHSIDRSELREVLTPARMPARVHETLTERLADERIVDLESVVDAVDAALEPAGQPTGERTDPAGSSGARTDWTEPIAQNSETTIETETDGGTTTSDRRHDDAGE